MNIHVHIFVQTYVFNSHGYIPNLEIAVGNLMTSLLSSTLNISTAAAPFCVALVMNEGSNLIAHSQYQNSIVLCLVNIPKSVGALVAVKKIPTHLVSQMFCRQNNGFVFFLSLLHIHTPTPQTGYKPDHKQVVKCELKMVLSSRKILDLYIFYGQLDNLNEWSNI